MRLLDSRWEDPTAAAEQRRPVRRLYRLTALGEHAVAELTPESPAPRRQRKLATA
jgi:DNA-binding PadR family transcriptional regulator